MFLKKYKLLLLVVFLLLIMENLSQLITAQQPEQWSVPERIPFYDDEAFPPHMVADENRTVHAFNTQPIDEGFEAIVYRQWTVTQGWTTPVDVLLSPQEGRPGVNDVLLDTVGNLHVIFFAGNELGGGVYYSTAPAATANNAGTWSQTVEIGPNAGVFGSAMTIDSRGTLYVVYEGIGDGIGVYETHSTDSGKTWTNPVVVSLVYGDNLWPTAIHLAVDPADRVHAVWSVWTTGSGEEVDYAALDTKTMQWANPIQLAIKDAGDYEADWPNIVAYNNELLVMYQDGFPATKWMRRSNNGGKTWSEPVKPFPHVGEYGSPQFVIDNSQTLHLILGNRNGDCCHGMWHGIWLGEHWSDLEAITMGPKTNQFDPTQPEAVISQGNVILATWNMDSAKPDNGIWYSFATLNVPELPLVLLPVPASTPTSPPSATTTPVFALPTPTLVPVKANYPVDNPPQNSFFSNNPAAPILVAMIPVVILMIGVIVVLRRRYF